MRGVFGKDTSAWYSRDPAHLVDRAKARGATLPTLKADCGLSDPYLAGNRAFRAALADRGVVVGYDEWPGAHDWNYWRIHMHYSLRWLGEKIAGP
jgi:S-formylglutathione hydrolase FrmB